MAPDWLDYKQPILVYNETVNGGIPTADILKYFPDFENAFEPIYEPMNYDDPTYYSFKDRVFEYSTVDRGERPYNLGSYLFYKMDRENHDYQMFTFFNTTTYHGVSLFPQFAYEATIKYAMEDPEISYNVRSTPLPRHTENMKKAFTADELRMTNQDIVNAQRIMKQALFNYDILTVTALAYIMLSASVIVTIITERPDRTGRARRTSKWRLVSRIRSSLWLAAAQQALQTAALTCRARQVSQHATRRTHAAAMAQTR
jgi:hypothetical protein